MGDELDMADALLMGYVAAGHSEHAAVLIRRHEGPLEGLHGRPSRRRCAGAAVPSGGASSCAPDSRRW